MNAHLERILSADYLGDIQGRPLEEIRAMRAECREVETGMSYLRRMVQGRLDIVRSALERGEGGGDAGDLSDLIERLPSILSDRSRPPGVGRLPQLLAPGEVDEELTAELDEIITAGRLAQVPDLGTDELAEVAEQLEALERRVSDRRHQLFERIDALQAEITRRYRTGEASVESLLQ
jgi:hypothetical protein